MVGDRRGNGVQALDQEAPPEEAGDGQDAAEIGVCEEEEAGALQPHVIQGRPLPVFTCRLVALLFSASTASFALGAVAALAFLREGHAPDASALTPLEADAAVDLAACNCSGVAAGAKPVAASYGFLYTPEGISILDELVRKASSSPKAALTHAEHLLRTNRHFLDACHPLLHRLGRMIFMSNRSRGLVAGFRDVLPFLPDAEAVAAELMSPLVIKTLDAKKLDAPKPGPRPGPTEVNLLMACNAAYLHGISELFLFAAGKQGNLEAALKFLNEQICSRFDSRAFGFRPAWECQHGLGHGIVQFKRHTMTGLALRHSLDLGVSTGRPGDVWNGVWMDHFASTPVSGHDADDPEMTLGVCTDTWASSARGAADCWMYAPTAFLLHRPRAYVDAIDWCRRGCARNSGCLSSCIQGVGMQTMKENLDDMRLVESVCTSAGGMATACVQGGTGYYYFATGHNVPDALCRTMRRADLRRACR